MLEHSKACKDKDSLQIHLCRKLADLGPNVIGINSQMILAKKDGSNSLVEFVFKRKERLQATSGCLSHFCHRLHC